MSVCLFVSFVSCFLSVSLSVCFFVLCLLALSSIAEKELNQGQNIMSLLTGVAQLILLVPKLDFSSISAGYVMIYRYPDNTQNFMLPKVEYECQKSLVKFYHYVMFICTF